MERTVTLRSNPATKARTLDKVIRAGEAALEHVHRRRDDAADLEAALALGIMLDVAREYKSNLVALELAALGPIQSVCC